MRHFIPYKRTNYILFTYSIVLLVCLRANKRLMGPQNVLKALICILNYKVTKWTREFNIKLWAFSGRFVLSIIVFRAS